VKTAQQDSLDQLVRSPPCHGGGYGFKSRTNRMDKKNYALAAYRKVKRAEKLKKIKELERYNNLCGPVTITKIKK
jgi:hypothetical protein